VSDDGRRLDGVDADGRGGRGRAPEEGARRVPSGFDRFGAAEKKRLRRVGDLVGRGGHCPACLEPFPSPRPVAERHPIRAKGNPRKRQRAKRESTERGNRERHNASCCPTIPIGCLIPFPAEGGGTRAKRASKGIAHRPLPFARLRAVPAGASPLPSFSAFRPPTEPSAFGAAPSPPDAPFPDGADGCLSDGFF